MLRLDVEASAHYYWKYFVRRSFCPLPESEKFVARTRVKYMASGAGWVGARAWWIHCRHHVCLDEDKAVGVGGRGSGGGVVAPWRCWMLLLNPATALCSHLSMSPQPSLR